MESISEAEESQNNVKSSTPIKHPSEQPTIHKTPSGPVVNPFESPWKEMLHMPRISPSTFHEVVSPSDKIDNKFEWTIDQKALIDPEEIEVHAHQFESDYTDHESERKLQETIERFFLENKIVPSPWSSSYSSKSRSTEGYSPKVMNSLGRKEIRNVITSKIAFKDACTQTQMSLPINLPKELEDLLSKYILVDDPKQCDEGHEEIETAINTSLRRKLFHTDHKKELPCDFSFDLCTSPVSDSIPNRRTSGILKCMASPNFSPIQRRVLNGPVDVFDLDTNNTECDTDQSYSEEGHKKDDNLTQSSLMPFDNFECNLQNASKQACSTRLQNSYVHSSGFYSNSETGAHHSDYVQLKSKKSNAWCKVINLPDIENHTITEMSIGYLSMSSDRD